MRQPSTLKPVRLVDGEVVTAEGPSQAQQQEHEGKTAKSDAARPSQLESRATRDVTVCVSFYRANDRPYGVFSNLYRRAMVFEGMAFETAEHAYQYGKARKVAVRDWMMAAPSPSLLAMVAHGLYSWDVAPGWSRTKVDRMRRVLTAKFTQHPDLAALLLSTGDARIVESASVDSDTNRFWGVVNGIGKNTLGVLLMELRATMRPERASSLISEPQANAFEVHPSAVRSDTAGGTP